MLERNGWKWLLDGRALRDGDLVEVWAADAWMPAVVVCGAAALALQGTADADPGHHAADPRMNLELERLAEHRIGLRRAWPSGSSSTKD